MKPLVLVTVFVAIQMGVTSVSAQDLQVPLTVREQAGSARDREPITTGVPLSPGLVRDLSGLAITDEHDKPIPAQFARLADWADGSVRWLLCDFQASVEANGVGRYMLGPARTAAPETPLRLEETDEQYTVTTGPLRFTVKRQGFDLLHEVWIDRDEDGEFSNEELMATSDADLGLVLLGPDGEGRYTSGNGEVTETAVEYQGPMRIGLRVRGTLRDARGVGELSYTVRIEAFAGKSYVRIATTLENPNPGGRLPGLSGNFWGLGAEGNVLFREFSLCQRLHLDSYPYVQVGEGGGLLLERLPLLDSAHVYQDSSGGDNWYHRNHVNRDLRIPLRFRGYEVVHEGTQVIRDDRFSGWLDVSDVAWGCAVGIRDFWQNFPSALTARADGVLSAALWPRFSAADHELIAGEQKTHETLWYFRSHPPYPRQVMGVLQTPLRAWAPAEVYLASGEFGRHVPYDEESYSGFERMCAAAILNQGHNFTTDRERIDEYGWRNFGDTWAANERDQTGGPRQRELMVSHFNLEYDEGWGMLLHAVRSVDARPEVAREWWRFGREAILHEADIDLHHSTVEGGEWPPWAGGKQTHTEHGVEAERSAHTGRVAPHMFGTLRWPWGPGGGPESGHFNNRGILTGYYLTGERRFLDAAMEITDLVAHKIGNDDFPQTEQPDREAGHQIQILTDAYLLTWESRYRVLLDQAVEGAHFQDSPWAKELPDEMSFWQLAIYMRALGRYVDVATFADGKPPARAVSSLVGYGRAMVHAAKAGKARGWAKPNGWSSDALLMAARYLDSDTEREDFAAIAGQAFQDGWRLIVGDDPGYVYHNAKTTTMNFTGGGEWMYLRAHPKDWLHVGPPVPAGE
jgi:hypothetical protein